MKITFDGMRALRWLSDHPNETQLPTEAFDAETSKAAFLELVGNQYIHDDRTIDDSYSFILTDAGSLVARTTRLQYRAELAQRAVLQSIDRNEFTNGLVDEAEGSDFTGPLDERELADATEELFDAKFIDGQRNANGRFSYVEITARGRTALRNPYPLTGSPADDRPNVTTNYSADNHGTIGNQVVGGAGHIVTSHIQQGISIEAVIDALRDIRNELHDPVDGDPAVDVAEDLDSVIRSGARRGWDWLKNELHNIVGSLAIAGRQELADRAQDVLRQIGT